VTPTQLKFSAAACGGGINSGGCQSMIRKSGDRFSEKIMLKQKDRTG